MTPNPAIIFGLGTVVLACLICILWVVVIEANAPPIHDEKDDHDQP